MKVDREIIDSGLTGTGFYQRACLIRSANADGVAQGDLGAAHLGQFRRKGGNPCDIHLALIGAAEHTGDVTTDHDTVVFCKLADLGEACKTFIDTAVDVALRKGL